MRTFLVVLSLLLVMAASPSRTHGSPPNWHPAPFRLRPPFKVLPRRGRWPRPWLLDKMPLVWPDPEVDYKVKTTGPRPDTDYKIEIAPPFVRELTLPLATEALSGLFRLCVEAALEDSSLAVRPPSPSDAFPDTLDATIGVP